MRIASIFFVGCMAVAQPAFGADSRLVEGCKVALQTLMTTVPIEVREAEQLHRMVTLQYVQDGIFGQLQCRFVALDDSVPELSAARISDGSGAMDLVGDTMADANKGIWAHFNPQ